MAEISKEGPELGTDPGCSPVRRKQEVSIGHWHGGGRHVQGQETYDTDELHKLMSSDPLPYRPHLAFTKC